MIEASGERGEQSRFTIKPVESILCPDPERPRAVFVDRGDTIVAEALVVAGDVGEMREGLRVAIKPIEPPPKVPTQSAPARSS